MKQKEIKRLLENKNFRNNQNYVISKDKKIEVIRIILNVEKVWLMSFGEIFLHFFIFIILIIFVFNMIIKYEQLLGVGLIFFIFWFLYFPYSLYKLYRGKIGKYLKLGKINVFRLSYKNISKMNTKYLYFGGVDFKINFDEIFKSIEEKNSFR